MRTTIELSEQHRAKLLELAAERGEQGFSRLVQEAIERYLAEEEGRQERIARALLVRGALDPDAAEALEESLRQSRSSWR